MNIRGSCRIRITGVLSTMAVATALMAMPAAAAPALPGDLETLIRGYLSDPAARGAAMGSAAEALQNGYPEIRLRAVIERSLEEGVSGGALSRMIEVLDDVHREGLPTQPYADKIMEGLAKDVREESILRALDKVDERIRFASRLVRDSGVEDEGVQGLIISTADAVVAGMDREAMQDVYSAMAGERANRRLEPRQIVEMVKTASGYGMDSGEVADFARSLMRDHLADEKDIRDFLDGVVSRARWGGSDRREGSIGSGGDDEGEDGDDDDGTGGEDSEGGSDEGHDDEGPSGSEDGTSDDDSDDSKDHDAEESDEGERDD